RADVAASYPALGPLHGYRVVIPGVAAGTHQLCVTLLNVSGSPGGPTTVPCQSVTVRHNPVGVAPVLGRNGSAVTAAGWAVDPDTTAGVTVRITFDGKPVRVLGAVLSRADVGAAYPDYGPKHGFSTLLHPAAGKHTICAGADNVSGTPGSASGLGCRVVTV